MSTPAEGMLILLLLGTKATDDAAVAASKRACTWALRHRWEDCIGFDDVIEFLLPVFSYKRLKKYVGTDDQTAIKSLSRSFESKSTSQCLAPER